MNSETRHLRLVHTEPIDIVHDCKCSRPPQAIAGAVQRALEKLYGWVEDETEFIDWRTAVVELHPSFNDYEKYFRINVEADTRKIGSEDEDDEG